VPGTRTTWGLGSGRQVWRAIRGNSKIGQKQYLNFYEDARGSTPILQTKAMIKKRQLFAELMEGMDAI
jgi:hypothetical protein